MLSTRKSRLKVSLTSLILIFSLTGVSQAHRHHSYAHESPRQAHNPNWMSVLPDSLRLSALSIPGTHDSLAFWGGVGAPRNFVKTQSMALPIQLESGIRVLDVRCAIVEDGKSGFFNIYHGNIYQHENFENVLKMVVKFLKDHPRETVLMRVKEENTDDPQRFEEIFRETYWEKLNYKDHMWTPTIPQTSQNPTLGEMRGKIVILQDFARRPCNSASFKGEFGLHYSCFDIQDEFQLIGRTALYKKWLAIKSHLDRADKGFNTDLHRETKFINYLSGVGAGVHIVEVNPYFVVSGHWDPATGAHRMSTGNSAEKNPRLWPDFPRLISSYLGTKQIFFEGTNTLVYGGIRTGYYRKRIGIIMTDFPGGGLIERIICLNYPKTDPLCRRLPPCTGKMCPP